MISFLTGSIARFFIKFVPSLFNLLEEYIMKEKSIEHDRLRLEIAKIQSTTQVDLKALESETPVRLARLQNQANEDQFERESKAMIFFNALIRPFTTLFWIILYPLLIWWGVEKGYLTKDPLTLLAPFTQDIIACILVFWFTDTIVQRRKGV
ncbi:hypothetical protein Q7L99_04410 [Candidatus Liberibacter asiaticus]